MRSAEDYENLDEAAPCPGCGYRSCDGACEEPPRDSTFWLAGRFVHGVPLKPGKARLPWPGRKGWTKVVPYDLDALIEDASKAVRRVMDDSPARASVLGEVRYIATRRMLKADDRGDYNPYRTNGEILAEYDAVMRGED